MNFINLNGKITERAQTGLPADNGAFRYGYGLFETMLVKDGGIQLKDLHWERLFDGLRQLYFEVPKLLTPTLLENEVMRTVQKNQGGHLCRVRLQMYAAGGGLYGLESKSPGFLIECFPLEPEAILINENGLHIGLAEGLNKSMDSLSNLKSCNALIYAMAARQAKAHKWNDALICNTHGNIIESTIANIFWVKDDVVYTPPLSEGCVAGVMRHYILSKIPVTEKKLLLIDILAADEVFLTNAIKRIKWVCSIADVEYGASKSISIYNSIFG